MNTWIYGVALAFVAATSAAGFFSQDAGEAVLGGGANRYRWVKDWAKLPEGFKLGNTHGGIVISRSGEIAINTDTENSIVAFKPDGAFSRAFGKSWHSGLHGMALTTEDGDERLYLVHTHHHELVKATHAGEVLWTVPWPQASGKYAKAEEFRPTAVAVADDGRFFIADGYGKSWVHRYAKDRSYLGSFGGPGTEPGKMRTPHGLWIDTRGKAPVLVVADRENGRLQVYDLDGNHLKVVSGNLRRPCGMHQWGELLAIADLAGRVTLLDKDFELVAHLGDNPDASLRAQNGVPIEKWKDGEFISPHAVRFDERGNLYVLEWLSVGRVVKLERLP